MIAWALFVGKSGRGRIFHAFDTQRAKSGAWRPALCGKWAKPSMLDEGKQPDAPGFRICRECRKIEGDTGKFSKWGAGR